MKIVRAFEDKGGLRGEWLRGAGPDADIVISSRIRLARNLRGHLFGIQASPEERSAIEEEVRAGLGRTSFSDEMLYLPLAETPALDAELLMERHLVSKELARSDWPRGACYAPDESVSIMVQEEDHLRIQVLRSGLQLEAAWAAADAVDTRISKHLEYAFSSRYGYLTCCPTNVGTGMRASVMLHLPALVYTKHVEKVFQAGAKMSLAVRGLYGEGTQPSSDFFQISNQVCLGVTETDVIDRLQRVVPQFIQYERKVREALLQSDRAALEDKCWRAYAVLRSARAITSEETLEMLSAVRLGVHVGLLPPRVTIDIVNELFILGQPAHLQRLATGVLEPKARDVARATMIRERLGAIE